MRAQDELKTVLREIVGPYLRSQGFKGSGSSWRRWTELEDCAVISVQGLRWNTSDEASCIINLGVVPKPWLEWEQHHFGRPINPKTMHASIGCWCDRIGSTLSTDRGKGERWWQIRDRDSAVAAADNMVERLGQVALPTLDRLLERDRMLDAVRSGESGFLNVEARNRRFAVLLSEHGPSPELDGVLGRLASEGNQATDECVKWVRARINRS